MALDRSMKRFSINSSSCCDVLWCDVVSMVHVRSDFARLRREARRMVLREAYWDRERGECVSRREMRPIDVERGEVLYDVRGFISPSISRDPYYESYLWLRVKGSS